MIAGLLRVKDECRWITRVIDSMRPVCDEIFVLDDHSTDGTPELCEQTGAIVCRSTFTGLDEARDRDYLLNVAQQSKAGWGLFMDGDELLEPGWGDRIRALTGGSPDSYKFRFVYLWDREDQMRVDGVYSRIWRQSFFRVLPGQSFMRTNCGGNFHCGSVPKSLFNNGTACEARIFHLGYLHREDRVRKYEWYNRVDPNNHLEDRYRHVVVGDLFPASARFLHGGPLRLQPVA